MTNSLYRAAFTALSIPVFAASAQAEAEKCTGAKDLVNAVSTMASFDAEMTSPLAMELAIFSQTAEGEPLTGERIFYRHAAAQIDLPLDTDGRMQNIHALAQQSPDGELCREAIGDAPARDKTQSSATMRFSYAPREDNLYALDLLDEGAQEGRKQLQKLAPAAVRFFVPKLTHIALLPPDGTQPDAEALPDLLAVNPDGADTLITPLLDARGARIYALADLKKSARSGVKVSLKGSLKVSGAAYRLEAMPKPDTQ